ncbi:MAG: hypothetical protein ACKO9I_02005 [Sphaerospermopsis kisseleviana]|jgi:hypothetical protein|uniref:Uncharacterized protein n=3 Tax=Sphaerospermopsis TaxID=752201 RepID=A0A479ZW33_9CYAN|nr:MULTISPECIES: hypothetical protein [Sphaerospermopsis]MEB3150042.1 hypothetical protein [Sphaerospermopsis sp.]BAZ83174.1 hypothetical protein NIES73_44610 [Sphaerospermopsis kisseleviana NIES-73]MBC5793885.1 hypothetical protein [Sphaerospermopsis sp. LEGE 00249]MBD2133314.1 hypothetical protein [Sphaerospermopsis sp. FACHB-1094]MBD2146307.1 hypothetical protein [Sphaerospermopsis sp. FACHB-1194]
MDSLQTQILTLSQKVDALYQVIENLDRKLSQGLTDCFLEQKQPKDNYLENHEVEMFNFKPQITFNSNLEHKDVLIDGIYPDMNMQAGDRQITPEIQIQRLTAQLTAAYNRIAALEEQLMRQRIY